MELRCTVGGCCNGAGVETADGAPAFCLSQQVETKVPLKSALCLYLPLETKSGSPVFFEAPAFENNLH